MNRFKPLVVVFASLAVGLLALGTAGVRGVPVAAGATICVNPGGSGGCQTTIQAAVTAAAAGDTVTVAAGTYKEDVTVARSITLLGAGAASTIVDATGLDNAIVVQSVTGATISGFTFENANRQGMDVENSAQLVITNNIVQGNDKNWKPPTDTSNPTDMGSCAGAAPLLQADCGEGMNLNGVSDSMVADNIVQKNQGGILLSDETAANHDNWIVGNTAQNNNDDCGITLASHPASIGAQGPTPGNGVYNNTIEDNIAMGNGAAGVGLFTPTPGTSTYNNIVTGNTLIGNGLPGVSMHSHAPRQNLNGNIITNNTISGNGGDMPTTAQPTGIIVFSDASAGAAPITGTVISHNRISNEVNGIVVGTTAINLSARANDLAATSVGLNNLGTGAVDASQNYWGCAGGPGVAGCSTVQGTVTTSNPQPGPSGS